MNEDKTMLVPCINMAVSVRVSKNQVIEIANNCVIYNTKGHVSVRNLQPKCVIVIGGRESSECSV